MLDTGGTGEMGARASPHLIEVTSTYLGLSVIIWVILLLLSAVIVGMVAIVYRKRRKRSLVKHLQKQRQAMEKASSDLFSQRGADEIAQAVNQPGKPQTRISEGAVA